VRTESNASTFFSYEDRQNDDRTYAHTLSTRRLLQQSPAIASTSTLALASSASSMPQVATTSASLSNSFGAALSTAKASVAAAAPPSARNQMLPPLHVDGAVANRAASDILQQSGGATTDGSSQRRPYPLRLPRMAKLAYHPHGALQSMHAANMGAHAGKRFGFPANTHPYVHGSRSAAAGTSKRAAIHMVAARDALHTECALARNAGAMLLDYIQTLDNAIADVRSNSESAADNIGASFRDLHDLLQAKEKELSAHMQLEADARVKTLLKARNECVARLRAVEEGLEVTERTLLTELQAFQGRHVASNSFAGSSARPLKAVWSTGADRAGSGLGISEQYGQPESHSHSHCDNPSHASGTPESVYLHQRLRHLTQEPLPALPARGMQQLNVRINVDDVAVAIARTSLVHVYAPPPPANVRAVDVSDTSITVSWDAVPEACVYAVQLAGVHNVPPMGNSANNTNISSGKGPHATHKSESRLESAVINVRPKGSGGHAKTPQQAKVHHGAVARAGLWMPSKTPPASYAEVYRGAHVTCTLQGLNPGQMYAIRVCCENEECYVSGYTNPLYVACDKERPLQWDQATSNGGVVMYNDFSTVQREKGVGSWAVAFLNKCLDSGRNRYFEVKVEGESPYMYVGVGYEGNVNKSEAYGKHTIVWRKGTGDVYVHGHKAAGSKLRDDVRAGTSAKLAHDLGLFNRGKTVEEQCKYGCVCLPPVLVSACNLFCFCTLSVCNQHSYLFPTLKHVGCILLHTGTLACRCMHRDLFWLKDHLNRFCRDEPSGDTHRRANLYAHLHVLSLGSCTQRLSSTCILYRDVLADVLRMCT
jgi:hypothetical protein